MQKECKCNIGGDFFSAGFLKNPCILRTLLRSLLTMESDFYRLLLTCENFFKLSLHNQKTSFFKITTHY